MDAGGGPDAATDGRGAEAGVPPEDAAGPGLASMAGEVRLRAVYQPIVDLRSGRTVAVEGLVRGARGTAVVPPAELFQQAGQEGPGALFRLDHACLQRVVASAATLPAGATLFVNVEPSTLATLTGQELAAVAALVPPKVQVVVEVTERNLLQQPAQMLAGVQRVRELGWRIAVDDVGAEPAALALVPFLRPDVIKLDLALVRTRPTLDVAAIVNAVNAEAQRSGALVLAEGIESSGHLQRALSLGATLGQGWHFARPGPLPRQWAAALSLPDPPAPTPAATSVFELISRDVAAQPTTATLLAPLTRQVERQALLLDEMTVVLASFQQAASLTPGTLRRYTSLAAVTALTAVLAPGVAPEPAPGVLGTALHEDDPLAQEWVVTVVSPHFAAALAAREATQRADAGDVVRGPADQEGPDTGTTEHDRRRLEYVLTYRRDHAVAAAGLLMGRLRARTPEPPAATSPTPGDVAATPQPIPGCSPTRTGALDQADRSASLRGVSRADLPALLTRAISTASNGIVIADARATDMPLVYANEAFERMTGYARQEVLGQNCRLLQGPATDRTISRVISRRLLAGRDVRVTLLNYRRDGSPFWNDITISPVHDDRRRLTHFIGNQVDVSDRVDREERTTYLAYHDALTGLPNRTSVLERLELELRRSRRTGDGLAVVSIDLKGLGRINEAHGHAVGDRVLILAAQRLRSAVRAGDPLARLGGEEFLLVLTGLPAGDDTPVRHAVRHLWAALAPPLEVAGRTLHVGVGTGHALAPGDGTSATDLMGAAAARLRRFRGVPLSGSAHPQGPAAP